MDAALAWFGSNAPHTLSPASKRSSPASCRGGLSSTPEVQEAEITEAFCSMHLRAREVGAAARRRG